MRITGGEIAVGDYESRSPFQGFAQLCRRFVEPATVKEGGTDPGQIGVVLARVEASESLKMLDPQIWPRKTLSSPLENQPRAKLGLSASERSTSEMATSMSSPEHAAAVRENLRVFGGGPQGSASQIDTLATVGLQVIRRAVRLEQLMTTGRQSEGRAVIRIVFDRLHYQAERLNDAGRVE